jgi:hypothetical protein
MMNDWLEKKIINKIYIQSNVIGHDINISKEQVRTFLKTDLYLLDFSSSYPNYVMFSTKVTRDYKDEP